MQRSTRCGACRRARSGPQERTTQRHIEQECRKNAPDTADLLHTEGLKGHGAVDSVNWVPSIVVALPAEQMLIRNVFHFFPSVQWRHLPRTLNRVR